MLRIIAGSFRGRRIISPDLTITRPTTDKVREAIFSSISFDLEGAICLDLFSGSGAMAIEAISRGAIKVIANEKHKKSFKVIQQNIMNLDVRNIELWNEDALRVLQIKNNTQYDFIFLDPPYEKNVLLNQCIENIFKNKMLKKHGYIIVETNNINNVVLPKGLVIQKQKFYGKTIILYISKI